MVKEQLEAVRQLIKAGEHEAARRMLKKINHPTAREWEVKLDKIAPPRKRNDMWVLVIVALVLIGVVAAGLWWQSVNQGVAEIYQTIEARPPGQ